MTISFGKFEITYAGRNNVNDALNSNWITQGPQVAAFEQEFAAAFRVKRAIAVSSGTDAGTVAWRVAANLAQVYPGDGAFVLTPACAFASTANSIIAAGLIPRFVDVDLHTLNVNPEKLFRCVNGHDDVIGVQLVHTMGKLVGQLDGNKGDVFNDWRMLRMISKTQITIISDACEAHGAQRDGVTPDAMADMTTYSFYPAHMIVCGEGGMITTGSDDFAERCQSIRSHGRRGGQNEFNFDRIGYNSKMTDISAAIGRGSLAEFPRALNKRLATRQAFIERLESCEDRLILYRNAPGEQIAPHAFPIVMRDENELVSPLAKFLNDNGIETKTLFGSLPTQHEAFRYLGYVKGDFPVAERIGRTGLHWACHEYLSEKDIDFVCDKVKEYLARKASTQND